MSGLSASFRRGDLIEVRSWAEIRATLDEDGLCECLAFMPEMLKYCGRRFVVSKRFTRNYKCPLGGTRKIRDVALLRDVFCDGSAHDGCQRACILCWNQAWFTKVDKSNDEPAVLPVVDASTPAFPYQRAPGRYRCQYDDMVVVRRIVIPPEAPRQNPIRRINRISVDEYANLQQAVGEKIVHVGGRWWRQVRPCFFRPLLPFQEFPAHSGKLPPSAWLGGAQHIVPSGHQANSTMSFLIFTAGGRYCLDSLRSKFRREVQSAERRFTVSELTDCTLFKEQAYPIYTAFHARTQYRYLTERLKKSGFDRWAETIFEYKPSLVLGAWHGAELCAVTIANAIEDTLIYSTFFGRDEALRDHVASLLLHMVRLRASQDGGITQVYVGMPKMVEGHGVDRFLTRRGCRVVTGPAALWLNPASKLLLRWFMSDQYARLRGAQKVPASVEVETAMDCTADTGER